MSAFQLHSWERRQLLNLLEHPSDAKQLRRAQALVWLHTGQPVLRVAALLRVEPRTVYNWVYAFQQRTDLDPVARLRDAPRSGRPPTALGIIDPLIDAVIDDDPRDYGYRATVWTAPLLQRYLEEAHGIETSRKSVSRAIARLDIRWKHRATASDFAPTPGARQRGLKNGLKDRVRTALLMLDETIITETPPLYCCYGRIGQQVSVPITGSHQRRILHGALNVGTGDVVLEITEEWNQVTHREFLSLVRAHWRGWNIVLFEDRAGQSTAPDSLLWADCLGIEIRLLPRATPELNAMDTLWKQVKRDALGDRPTESIDQSAAGACEHILAMGPHDRLRQAGVLSGNFWLTK